MPTLVRTETAHVCQDLSGSATERWNNSGVFVRRWTWSRFTHLRSPLGTFPEKAGSTGIIPKLLIRCKILSCRKQEKEEDSVKAGGQLLYCQRSEETSSGPSLRV